MKNKTATKQKILIPVFTVVAFMAILWMAVVLIPTEKDIQASRPFEYSYPAGFIYNEAASENDQYQERYVHTTADPDFPTNIWITVITGGIDTTLHNHAQATLQLAEENPQIIEIALLEEDDMKIDSQEGYFITTRVTDELGPYMQKQFFYTKSDRTIYITLTASNESFSEIDPSFTDSISTFYLLDSGVGQET